MQVTQIDFDVVLKERERQLRELNQKRIVAASIATGASGHYPKKGSARMGFGALAERFSLFSRRDSRPIGT